MIPNKHQISEIKRNLDPKANKIDRLFEQSA